MLEYSNQSQRVSLTGGLGNCLWLGFLAARFPAFSQTGVSHTHDWNKTDNITTGSACLSVLTLCVSLLAREKG